MTTSSQFIEHLSEKPWSDYTASDYSIDQWHNACLIHQHDGAPTAKGQCKLPVKTPNGAVNRNACHAAVAALAGARGGVHASSDEKASAAKSLIRLYHQMNEDPPASLMRHSLVNVAVEFIEHHGIKGMKWGVRRQRQPSISKKRSKSRPPSARDLSDEDLRKAVSRMQMEQQYSNLMSKRQTRSRGAHYAQSLLRTSGKIASDAARETVKNMVAKRMQSALEEAMKGKKNKQMKLFK